MSPGQDRNDPIASAGAAPGAAQPIIYCLRHFTEYRYGKPVEHAHNQLRMHLRETPHQHCLQRSLRILPRPVWAKQQSDYFNNLVLWVEMDRPHTRSRIFIKHLVEVKPDTLVAAELTPAYREMAGLAHGPELAIHALPSRLVPVSEELRKFGAHFFRPDTPVLAGALALMHHIHETFTFDPSVTSIATPVAEVLAQRRGVCQDFSHLMIGTLRSLGLSARYVSGYIETHPPKGQPRLVGADASHAWLSLWCGPQAGWQDLDPTNGQRPNGQHLVTAWGRDYDDIIPLNGVISGGGRKSSLEVRVDLQRIVLPSSPVTR